MRKVTKTFLADLDQRLRIVENQWHVKADPALPRNDKNTAQILLVADNLAWVDKPIDVRVRVSGPNGNVPTGSITLYADGRALSGTTKELFHGSTSGTLTYNRSGHHVLTAKYTGDDHHTAQPDSNAVLVEVR